MNIAFHSNQLGIRGTEVALYDYALNNEQMLQNKSFIISDSNSDLSTLKKFQDKFDVFLYKDFKDCYSFIEKNNISHVYYIKSGVNDGKIMPNAKNLIHVVFQNKEIHGDCYAYISKWLAEKMELPNSYVPHIVDLPKPTQNYRKQLNIPKNNIVIGRYGGFFEFNIRFVHQAVYNILEKRNDITFLFMNTARFCPPHPNILFVNNTISLQNKSNFIETCDYMIHAREDGETFGLSICEFLYGGKPVIAWTGGHDRHHTVLLKDTNLLYNDKQDLENIFMNLNPQQVDSNVYTNLVKQFSPKNVMKQFKDIFLN